VLLSVSDLSVRFGPMRAVDGIDLEIDSGELVALAGENGAGKTTLVRCVAGDVAQSEGEIMFSGRRVRPGDRGSRRVAVVWQDLALCDNLDIAANLFLGAEGGRVLLSDTRAHKAAAALLGRLGIDLGDTARPVQVLSGGQRQLLAVARAMRDRPEMLILDEPTASLGVNESAHVEDLITTLHRDGTAIILVSHDVEQMYRLATRIVVLRHGRLVGNVSPGDSYPDDVVSLISGQRLDNSPRRQLTRLHGLVGQLTSTNVSSSLDLILSALAPALGVTQICIHLCDIATLTRVASLGMAPELRSAWASLPMGELGGPPGRAAVEGSAVVDEDLRTSAAWAPFAATAGRVRGSWAVPVVGGAGLIGTITVLRTVTGRPRRDQLDLLRLYAAHVAGTLERDRLLREVTARNRVLETIREVLQTLAGPVPVSAGLTVALQALRAGLGAAEVALWTERGGMPRCRAFAAAGAAAAKDAPDLSMRVPAFDVGAYTSHRVVTVPFDAPGGRAVLLARWDGEGVPGDATALAEDAARSFRLALEREDAEMAHREASALRRSQELQHRFLSRLSHELRTPLTGIRGYASSLLQPDVTFDAATQERFLTRIATESARLGRLVNDLLDYSAIESGILRLHPDWCDLALVLEAAVSCLPPGSATTIDFDLPAELPAVWADHDRLEQVFVNLLDNAFRHNAEGTRVRLEARPGLAAVVVRVADDGAGVPVDQVTQLFDPARRPGGGSTGLGLSIAHGIVTAHHGSIELEHRVRGACFSVRLPIEGPAAEGVEHE
jgi:signal transduction histidine kinase/ABC-type multidrug transport system ATPase subunit